MNDIVKRLQGGLDSGSTSALRQDIYIYVYVYIRSLNADGVKRSQGGWGSGSTFALRWEIYRGRRVDREKRLTNALEAASARLCPCSCHGMRHEDSCQWARKKGTSAQKS